MKKRILILCTSVFASLTIEAQTLVKVPNIHPTEYQKKVSEPSKIKLEEGEKIMGFYTTDELPKTTMGFGEIGEYAIGTSFPTDIIGKYATREITKVRFGLGEAFGTSIFSIYEMDENEKLTNLVYTSPEIETVTGWNEITLASPITIKKNTRYFFTYTYKEIKQNQYSILSDIGLFPEKARDGGMWAKFGDDWYKQKTSFGNLVVQAIVKGGDFIDHDLAINNLKTTGYVKKGGKADFTLQLENWGNKLPESYELAVTIDGQAVEADIQKPATLKATQEVAGTFTFPTDLEGVSHKLELSIASINGIKPTENISDDVATTDFKVYSKSLDRQKSVVELFTSQYCPYCPGGSKIVSAATAKRNDIAIVAVHLDMGYQAQDKFTIAAGNELATALSNGYLPGMAINRYYIDNPVINKYKAITIHPAAAGGDTEEEAAENLSKLFDEINMNATPAFANVNINTIYDEATRNLDITVSGNATNEAKELYGPNTTLTILLTEDNLKALQMDGGQMDKSYIHNNVLRAVVTKETAGDAINWIDETNYSNTFNITLNADWIPQNMNVIAYITPSFNKINDIKNLSVSNANKVAVTSPAGIEQSIASKEAMEVARFTIDGRQITKPVQGINIIKMSDGTTVKEFIK